MANFVLVHGASLGAWCWRDVESKLRAMGHVPKAIDLPGHGEDRTSPSAVTLQHYETAVREAVLVCATPVILVGHSNCVSVVQGASSISERIGAMVYIAGVIPEDGATLMNAISDGGDPRYLQSFSWAADGRSAMLTEAGAREFLFHLSDHTSVDRSIEKLSPEPVAPYEVPVSTCTNKLARIPAYYIKCLHDRVVPAAVQEEMIARLRPRHVLAIDADHCPFLCCPDELAAILDRIAREAC